jgi:ketosteroid isomerase-like protein
MDQLISFHAYGDKFVEFNGGQSFDSAGNEHNERQLFGEDLEEDGVIQFAAVPGTLKVAVYYGNVANLTFTSDFILMHKEYGEITVNNLITLLFVKTKGEWKLAHEHHSPVDGESIVEETGSASTASESRGSVIDQTYTQAQAEVLETFGAIAQSITAGAGHGYNSEYMDQLISFHAYGDKFVEFNGGQSFDSAGNEHNERQLFGEDLEEDGVIQFAAVPGTLKVAVYYGNVANLTFTSDFILMHREYGEITVNNLITLLFVKTKGDWKLVHEHHSPFNE